MTTMSLAKAVIVNLDKPGSMVECMFNPKEYTFSKTNNWIMGDVSGANMPKVEFTSGQPATLNMELFFDTYTYAKGLDPPDVREVYTNQIWELMMVDERLQNPKSTKGRPPFVRFQWGMAWSFNAVITSITQRFTLFLPHGTPVRATLNVQFQQIRDERLFPKQNPTSGGTGGERVVTVEVGDTLAWIAYKEYGDATRWRAIAEANRLTHVRQLPPGLILVIPHG